MRALLARCLTVGGSGGGPAVLHASISRETLSALFCPACILDNFVTFFGASFAEASSVAKTPRSRKYHHSFAGSVPRLHQHMFTKNVTIRITSKVNLLKRAPPDAKQRFFFLDELSASLGQASSAAWSNLPPFKMLNIAEIAPVADELFALLLGLAQP